MSLFLRYAGFRQIVDNCLCLDFEFTRQLIDSDLIRIGHCPPGKLLVTTFVSCFRATVGFPTGRFSLRCFVHRNFFDCRWSFDLLGCNIRCFNGLFRGFCLLGGVFSGLFVRERLERFRFHLRIFKRLEIRGYR